MDITIMKSNKRSRDSNWSETEKQLLKELVKDHIQIIENKTNDSRALMQKKKVWSEVQQQLAAEGYVREMNRIKEQWGRMKLTAKGSITKYKKHQKGTGGGGPSKDVPTESDWEIRDMIPYEFEDDVAEFDSDALPVHSTAFESDGTEIVLNYETGELTEAALDIEDYQMQITNEVPTKNMKTAVGHVAKTPKILRPRVMKKNVKSAINKSVVENAIIENRIKQINRQQENEDNLQQKRLLVEETKLRQLENEIQKADEIHNLRVLYHTKKAQLIDLQLKQSQKLIH